MMTRNQPDSSQESPRSRYLPFPDAKKFAKALRLKTHRQWKTWAAGASRPADVPTNPDVVYRARGWMNWYDWLGNAPQSYREFGAARDFARSLKLKAYREWPGWVRGERRDLPPKPQDIPSNPYLTYADRGWSGWGDFLGTGHRNRPQVARWRPFEQARAYVTNLGLSGPDDYKNWAFGYSGDTARPRDIPAYPQAVYRGEWSGWDHFLNL